MKAKYVPKEVYSTFYPGAGEIAEMFDWFHNYGYAGEKVTGKDILFYFFHHYTVVFII